MMPYILDCEIASHDLVAPGHYRMTLDSHDLAKNSRAGQFCMMEVQEGYYPFLRRPMCFERIFHDGVSILYKVEGEGTRLLSRMTAGQCINVQGPLGQPFPIRKDYERHIMVAGGIGVAPFPALAEALIEELGVTPEVVLAARSEELLLCMDTFRYLGCKVHIATDDGSAGLKAYASELLAKLKPGPGTIAYCCGPMPMMKATHRVCQDLGMPLLASLEAEMACGDGVCLGCVVEAKVEIEAERMVRVCYDGPVFDSEMINWEAY